MAKATAELRVIDLGSKQERVLATGHLTRSNRGVAWSPDNRWVEVFYLEQGRISVIPLDTRQARSFAITAYKDVHFAEEKMERLKDEG